VPSRGPRPYLWRGLCLGLGALWGVVAMVLILTLQVNPANLRTEQGQPVTHTVFSDQPILWVVTFVGIALILVVAALELVSRARLQRAAAGTISLLLGSVLCLLSLFGLGYGVAAIAPIGAMVIVSGTALSRRAATSPDPA
jgi:hypothetical protein